MREAQKDITRASRQILSTLSLLPAIQAKDIQASSEIFRAVLKKNPEYNNITLTDLNGDVLASGREFSETNLSDRKHFREALERKDFAVGEYILSRTGTPVSAFAFAYPILDKNDRPKAMLTMSVKQEHFSRFYDISTLPDKSFVAVTDHQGIRLFYYPAKDTTNPIGKPIKAKPWEIAQKAKKQGIFIGKGSDGVRIIVAFEQVRLTPEDTPYSYVWAGIPEEYILGPANAALARNLLIMFLATTTSLFLAWLLGRKTLISPIKTLVNMTQEFARGNLDIRSEQAGRTDEFGALTKAFHNMATALTIGQKTLQENEARFRLLLNSLDALVYVADMDTYEVLFVNEYGKKIHGDITGKICWQSIQKDQSGPCSFCTNKYLLDGKGKPGKVYTWDFQHTVTGQWFHIHDRAISWIDDRIVRLEVATDITERKLAETRLAEETERLAVTLRSIGDGVITTDTQGRIALINKVAETLTGWNSEEAVGQPLAHIFNIINNTTRKPCDNPVEKILTSGGISGVTNDTVLISKDGQERSIDDSGAPIRDKDGKTIGIVLVFRDITKQLRTEQELIKVKKLESIGVLAGGIAHDFNNILAAILGNIDLSLLDSNLSVETQKLLKDAIKASQRAQDLTRQLLTFAKGGEPIKEAASLAEVVKDSADFVLRGDKVACRYVFPDDLWLVDIDKGQISQVVQNIMLNASNAMPNGGIVKVSCENVPPASSTISHLPKTGRYVKMKITDTGTGIPANVLDKIFDPYFSTKQEGSGIGLAITHSIINKHGGHISAESTPGIGTIFTIYLPASTQRSVPVRKAEETILNTKKSKIMVMDDEEQIRAITQAMLGLIGHEVVLAKDGMEALQFYREAIESKTPIDLIIMDLTVPGGMGGKETVQKILAINSEAKVIVSSGYSNDPVMANFKDYGFCAAIAKPYQLPELKKIISQSIGQQ
ncbi:MAG: PAS domain S-box protein, partial [Proteobacteria bacterium]|nr:PAS domain S-box protein [Pseudomonadota bacterium]